MQKVFLIMFVGVLGLWIARQAQESSTINDVLLENVEALANFESTLPISCEDSGGCTCPINGKKYAFIYEGYSFVSDEETY